MNIISVISAVSPVLGKALGGPAGGVVSSIISKVLGVNMNSPESVKKALEENPECAAQLKELELELAELQSARNSANQEEGFMRYVRPILVLLAFLSLFADIVLLMYVKDEAVRQLLWVFTGVLILDIRQIYKLYFGNWEEKTNFMAGIFKKK